MASDLSKEAVEAVRMAALDAADVLTNSMAFNPAQAVVDLVRVTGALSAERDALAARLAEVGGRSVPTRGANTSGFTEENGTSANPVHRNVHPSTEADNG